MHRYHPTNVLSVPVHYRWERRTWDFYIVSSRTTTIRSFVCTSNRPLLRKRVKKKYFSLFFLTRKQGKQLVYKSIELRRGIREQKEKSDHAPRQVPTLLICTRGSVPNVKAEKKLLKGTAHSSSRVDELRIPARATAITTTTGPYTRKCNRQPGWQHRASNEGEKTNSPR